MDFETEQLATALDTVSFLARSPGRIHVLDVLAEEDGPHDRASLREATGVPRTTVGRIVTHLHERGLITERGHECRITPLGEMLMTEFDSLLRTAVTVETLRPVLRWLPVEELDFSLDHFADAEITLATPHDTTAAIDRAIEFIGAGDSVRIVAFGVAPRVIEAAWRATVHGEQTHEFVLAAETVDALLSDPNYRKWFGEIARSERGAVFRYPGTVPFNVALIDGAVGFALIDEHGAPAALLRTDNEVIRSWADSTIDTYRDVAEPIDRLLFRE